MARPTILETAGDGDITGVSVIESGSMTGVDGHLYVAHVSATRTFGSITVTGVTGLGLTWTLVKEQCSATGTSQDIMSVWYAIGDATTGTITATLSTNAAEVQLYVTRWQGVDASDPIGQSVGYNTNGADGACSGGVASDDAQGVMTVDGTRSVVVMATVQDDSTMVTATPGWTTQIAYSGTSAQSTFMEYRTAPQGALALGAANNLSGADQWALVAVEIRGAAIPAQAPRTIARFFDPHTGRPLRDIAAWQ